MFRHTIAIDELDFDFAVVGPEDAAKIDGPPADGCYVRGLFLEGADWDVDNEYLMESQPKVLYVPMPIIWLIVKKSEVSFYVRTRVKKKSCRRDLPCQAKVICCCF